MVTACSSATNAIGEAYRHHYGYADIMFAGGSEAPITETPVGGLPLSMKALSPLKILTGRQIPFDKKRDGFVMGEGATVLVLEEYEHAVNRGAISRQRL